jgi:hypothetical protein
MEEDGENGREKRGRERGYVFNTASFQTELCPWSIHSEILSLHALITCAFMTPWSAMKSALRQTMLTESAFSCSLDSVLSTTRYRWKRCATYCRSRIYHLVIIKLSSKLRMLRPSLVVDTRIIAQFVGPVGDLTSRHGDSLYS